MFLAVGDLRLGVHGWAGDTIGLERHGDSSNKIAKENNARPNYYKS